MIVKKMVWMTVRNKIIARPWMTPRSLRLEVNTMSKTVAGLIQHCKDKLGTPYVYGAKGEVLTQTILDRLAREVWSPLYWVTFFMESLWRMCSVLMTYLSINRHIIAHYK